MQLKELRKKLYDEGKISDSVPRLEMTTNRVFGADRLYDVGLTDKTLDLIRYEDEAQLEKWGEQRHSMFEWLAFTTEELGELSEAMSEFLFREGHIEAIENEAVQVATLAIKIAGMCKALRGENNED